MKKSNKVISLEYLQKLVKQEEEEEEEKSKPWFIPPTSVGDVGDVSKGSTIYSKVQKELLWDFFQPLNTSPTSSTLFKLHQDHQ